MNTFVITINNTTFNFVVSPGTTIDIKVNPSGSVENNINNCVSEPKSRSISDISCVSEPASRCISDISCVSESVSDATEILDTIQNITFRNKKYNNFDDSDSDEFCKPVKHSYEKDAEGNYMCPYCDAKKKKVNTLSEHVRANHSTEYGRNKEMFYCDECEKGFPTKTRRDHHVKTFHAINYEKCPHLECSYNTAKNASSLIQHYVKHHMPYKQMYKTNDNLCVCNDCGYSSKTGILYHLGICNKSSPFYKNK